MNETEIMNRYYREWWENPRDLRNIIFRSLNQLIYQRIPNGKGKKALDIGAGKGTITSILINKGYDVTAIDINKQFIEDLQLKYKQIKTLCGDIRNINFNETYDVATFVEVIQNIPPQDTEQLLKKIGSLCRILYTNISNSKSLHGRWVNFRKFKKKFVYDYYPQQFENMMNKVGFEIQYRRGIGLLTPLTFFPDFNGKFIPTTVATIINKNFDDSFLRNCHLYYIEAKSIHLINQNLEPHKVYI